MSAVVLPYPGLRAFARDESHLFFGREGCVDKMIERLASTRFLAVLGASGSGKSSMVRTGLLDGLELGFHAQAGSRWTVVETHPGGAPLRNLAASIIRATGGDPGAADAQVMRALLARGPRSLVEWCKSGQLAPGGNLLVLVDQFEELFRYADYAAREEAEAFCALLLESSQAAEVPIHIVLTMRSEYLGACALIPGLAETINSGFFLTPRMTREECRSAIEGPAAVCGFTIEPALVNTMLNDMAGFAPWEEQDGVRQSQVLSRRADQLPLMQHVLNRLWLKARERAASGSPHLTLQDYEAGGRLTGALDAHGAEIMAALREEDRSRAAVVLRTLVSGPDLANAVRRPSRFAEIAEEVPGGAPAARRIVEALRANGCNFLMPPPPTPIEADTVIDIGHESLIRQWSVMSALLESEARAGAEWGRLRLAAQRHKDGRGSLLAGADLASTQAWWESDKPTATWSRRHEGGYAIVAAFLKESLSVESAYRQEVEAREHQQRATLKKQRNLYLFFVLTLLPLLVSALILGYQSRQRAGDLAAEKITVSKQYEVLRVTSENLGKSILSEKDAKEEAISAKEEAISVNRSLSETNRQLELEKRSGSYLLAKVNDQYARLRPYEDYLLLSAAMKAAGFVRNPKISSDVVGVALSGYDPVSYFQGNEPTLGSPSHFALKNGAIWLFASERNRSTFVGDPERYMPALGGFCAPCLYSGKWFHGRPTAWHVVNSRLYLASTPDLANEFRKSADGYLAKAKPNFEEARGFVDSAPNVPTAVGKVLQSYILVSNTPDAYAILQQSASDFARMGDHYAAASQQREAVELLLKSPDIGRIARDVPKALALLSNYRLLNQDYVGAEQAAKDGLKRETGSLELRDALAKSLLSNATRQEEALALIRPRLGVYIGDTELFWEEKFSRDLEELSFPTDAKSLVSDVLKGILATPLNCNRFKVLAEEDSRQQNWKQAATRKGQQASCLQNLPKASKRRAREVASAFSQWAVYSLASGDYAAVRKISSEGLNETPDLGSHKALGIIASLLLGDFDEAARVLESELPSGESGEDSLEMSFNQILALLGRLSVKTDAFAETQRFVARSVEFSKLERAAADAFRTSKDYARAVEQQEKALEVLAGLPRGPKVKATLAGSYSDLAWYRLLAGQPAAALNAAEAGLSIEPDRLALLINKAHALLLSGRQIEAEKIYASKLKTKFRNGKTWEAETLSDLEDLERVLGPIQGASRVREIVK